MTEAVKFRFPSKPEDLENASEEFMYVTNVLPVEDDPETFAEGLMNSLQNQEEYIILDQDTFNGVYSVCKHFGALDPRTQMRLIQTLSANLNILLPNIDKGLRGEDDDEQLDRETARAALKAYVFFLQWLPSQGQGDAAAAAAALAHAAPAKRGGRKKARPQDDPQGEVFNVVEARVVVVRAFALVVSVSLVDLFRPEAPDDAMVRSMLVAAIGLMEDKDAMKEVERRNSAFFVVMACALTFGQTETACAALVELLNKCDHAAGLMALLCEMAEKHMETNRLTVSLIQYISSVDPAAYSDQQKQDSQGVKNVGQFISELGKLSPRTLAAQMALLLPHLGGDSYTIRSEIVTAIGHILERLFPRREGQAEVADAQQAEARIRQRQGLQDILLSRIHDTIPYTRSRALQTWEALVRSLCVDIGKWATLTRFARGRLEDKSVVVRKSAIRLIRAMIEFSPFGPTLDIEMFEATLQERTEKLEAIAPQGNPEDPFAGAEGEGEGQGADGEEKAAAPGPGAPGRRAEIEGLRAVISTLKSAIEFSGVIESGVSAATDLLASSNDSDVVETVELLKVAVQSHIRGARAAARRMLPLVFSAEAGVRSCVLSAVHRLYLDPDNVVAGNNADPARMSPELRVAISLIELARGSNLGELSALEEIVKSVAAVEPGSAENEGQLSGAVLRALFGECDRAAQEAAKGIPGAVDVARNALSVLAMATAARPDVVVENLDTLVRAGLKSTDGLMRRHAASVLKRLGPVAQDWHRSERGLPPLFTLPDPAQLAKEAAAAQEARGKQGRAAQARRTPVTEAVALLTQEDLESSYRALLAALLLPPGALPDPHWFAAAEMVVAAIYAVHPAPGSVLEEVLIEVSDATFTGGAAGVAGAAEDAADADADAPPARPTVFRTESVSRLLFLVGHVALRHLLHVEEMGRVVRQLRLDRDRKDAAQKADAPEPPADPSDPKKKKKKADKDKDRDNAPPGAAGPAPGEDDDIAKQVGVGAGSAAEDAELDAMVEAAQREIVGGKESTLIGRFGPLVRHLCLTHARNAGPSFRSAALLALTKLMAVDGEFCDQNLEILFTWLDRASWGGAIAEPEVRSNLIVALGDLVVRFPNAIGPWIEKVYAVLSDTDTGVRRNAVLVLSHLILNDMVKVYGSIASLARCLVDPDDRIQGLTRLFFQELGKKNNNPISNLLSDILSNLSNDEALSDEDFRKIMGHLLTFIQKDRQTETLVNKLLGRLQEAGRERTARNVAYCLTQLQVSDKSLSRMTEEMKQYAHALHDEETVAFLHQVASKARKQTGAGAKDAIRKVVDDFEARLKELSEERRGQWEAENKAKGALAADARRAGRKAAAAGAGEGEAAPQEGAAEERAGEAEEEPAAAAAAAAAPRGKGRGRKAADKAPKPAKPAKKRGGAARAAESDMDEDEAADWEEEPEAALEEEKPAVRAAQGGKGGKGAKGKRAREEEEEEEEPAPKKGRGRKK